MAEVADTQRLIALVEANTKQFERAMDRLAGVTRSSMSKVEKEVSKVDSALRAAGAAATSFLRGFAVGAITAGVAGLGAMAKNAISAAAAFQDISENTGIAAEELQKFAFAAEQSGGNAESLLNSFKKFNVEIGEARNKGGQLADILKANGVSLDQDNLAIWRQIVDLIANAKDETDAAYLAQLAMGRSASDNLEFFRQGTDQMTRLGQEAEQSGIIINNELVERADEFADRWSKAMAILKGQTASWILSAIDALDKFDEYWKTTAIGQISPSGKSPGFMTGGGVGRGAADLLQGKAPAPPTVFPLKTTGANQPAFGDYDKVTAKLEKMKTVSQELTEAITDGFKNMGSTLLGVARGTERLDKALQRTLDNIMDKLADAAFQRLISAIVGGGFGGQSYLPGVGPGGKGFLGFGGPRQSGGSVNRGKAYLVGERGPELFSPNTSGYVTPRGRWGGMGGGTQVHIHTPPGMITETKQDRSGNGQRVDVLIRNMVRQELSGSIRPVLRDQYGITPAGRRRF